MGIKNLNTLIEQHSRNGKQKEHLSKYSGSTFAVDTNVYLYKYLYGKSNHIDGMFFMINKFKKFNITPIFIFDGKPPTEKSETIKNRRLIKNKLEEKLSLLKIRISNTHNDNEIVELQTEIDNIEKKIIYVNKIVIDKTKQLFDLMGIIYITADCEAEHYCSKLCNLNLVDGVVSEDMDTVACGCKLVIRNFTNRDDYAESYILQEILYDLNISYTSFSDLCIMLGNDYNHRPRGFIPNELLKLILDNKNIESLIKNNILDGWNCNYEKIREIFKLNEIVIDTGDIISQYNKKPNLTLLKIFLKENSSIEEKTYLHRINLIYFQQTRRFISPHVFNSSEYSYKLYNKYKVDSNEGSCGLNF
jgi:flap endonuclease-1